MSKNYRGVMEIVKDIDENTVYYRLIPDNYSEDQSKLLIRRMKETMDVIYSKNGYTIYKIKQVRIFKHGAEQPH